MRSRSLFAAGVAAVVLSGSGVPAASAEEVAALTVTAQNATRLFGAPNPQFAPAYAGFAEGDSPAALTAPAVCTSTATPTDLPGEYPVTCSGASSPAYEVTYVPGTLVITKAPTTLSVKPNATGLRPEAVLTRTHDKAPVAGRKVSFKAKTGTCSAKTDAAGVARCGGAVSLLVGGFTATFAGSEAYEKSTAAAKL